MCGQLDEKSSEYKGYLQQIRILETGYVHILQDKSLTSIPDAKSPMYITYINPLNTNGSLFI
jgi:hypothetical protein